MPIEAEAITARAVASFLLWLVPLFVLFLWLYPRLAPMWARWVLLGANAGYRACSVPLELGTERGGEALASYVALPSGGSEVIVTEHPENVFLGLILVPALLLATPIDLRGRWRLFLAGVALLYLVHVLCIAVLFYELLRLRQGHSGPFSDWLFASILMSGQIGSVVVWALLAGPYWFPRARMTRGCRGRAARIRPA
jgi:hypothetical protein